MVSLKEILQSLQERTAAYAAPPEGKLEKETYRKMAFNLVEGRIAYKPKMLSHAQAAALPLVGVSAWRALSENIGLSKDQKILINGGAGGIGSIAIQLAKNLGASSSNNCKCKRQGVCSRTQG